MFYYKIPWFYEEKILKMKILKNENLRFLNLYSADAVRRE